MGKELANDEKTISGVKNEIIIDKNNLLFGYITSKEAVYKFDDIKESYASTSSNYDFFLHTYNDVTDNKEKKEELKKDQLEVQLMIDNIKKMMKDFDRTQNVQFVNDVIELYVKEMTPKLNNIMKNRYAVSSVEYDDVTNVYNLMQIPVSTEGLEINLAEKEPGVVSMQMGMGEKIKRTHTKTVKARQEGEMKIIAPKKQTKKVRKRVLVIDPEPEPELELEVKQENPLEDWGSEEDEKEAERESERESEEEDEEDEEE